MVEHEARCDVNAAIPVTREAAQRRIDQIEIFERELAQIHTDLAINFTDSQATAVKAYHRRVTHDLTARYDADASEEARHLSFTMRIVSFIGACSLGASVFLIFYHFWEDFNLTTQTLFLGTAPLATLALALFVRGRDASGYFLQLSAALCYSCFVLFVVVLPSLWNIDPGVNRVLVCGIFALILAYGLRMRLLLCAALAAALTYSAAWIAQAHGAPWWEFERRPENFFFAAGILLLVPAIFSQRKYPDFAALYRIFAGIGVFTPMLVLGGWPSLSYLAYDPAVVAAGYQIAALAGSVASIYVGVRYRLTEIALLGGLTLLVLIVQKACTWLLPVIPVYEFFVLMSTLTVACLLVLKLERGRVRARPPASLP